MDVDIGMAVAFTAGMLLGGTVGAVCIWIGINARRRKHEKVQNVVYNKKII